jgi:hypothetical protein
MADAYVQLLIEAFNPTAVAGLMCRNPQVISRVLKPKLNCCQRDSAPPTVLENHRTVNRPPLLAVDAFVENLASVNGHHLALSEAADRAHQHGFQKNVDHINANQFKSHLTPRERLLSRFSLRHRRVQR